MRRLLALPLAASAMLFAVPAAHASFSCTPYVGHTRVCYQVSNCPDVCFIDPAVDPQCQQGDPATVACPIIDRIYLRPFPSR